MKKLFASIFAFFAVSCGSRGGVFSPGEVVYQPAHAVGFTIFEAGRGSSVIRITDPWQGAEGVEQWVFVSADGEQAPAGFTGVVLKAPARRVVCMSSSHVAFLSEMGASERIVGVSGGDFISDEQVRRRLAGGEVHDVGYAGALDYERFAALKPDLVLAYGVSDGEDDGGMADKLRAMGVPCVFVGDWLESSPQGRAEWMVAVGAMCGLQQESAARFGEIAAAYDSLAARVAAFAADGRRPGVMFNAPYRDVWYVPGDDNYMIRLVDDAGGEYVCRGTSPRDSRPIDIEQAWVAMRRAAVWINTNDYSTMAELLADNPRFADTPPVRAGLVYNNNARVTPAGGSDFWESGVVRPDLILLDLAAILHPEEFAADSVSLYYYKKLQ
jgi:iron complex transport system substrate-binding protein